MAIDSINSSLGVAGGSFRNFMYGARAKKNNPLDGLKYGDGTAVGTGKYVGFNDVSISAISGGELKNGAQNAMTETRTDFMNRFMKAFDSQGEWLEQSVPKAALQEVTTLLEQKLKDKDTSGAREVLNDFFHEIAPMVSEKMLEIGSRSSRTMRSELQKNFSNLVFTPKSGDADATADVASAKDGSSLAEGEYTTLQTSEGDQIKGYRTANGFTVMEERDPNRLPDETKLEGAADLIDSMIKNVQSEYFDRMESAYGMHSGAPGIETAIEEVMGRIDSLFRNAYQNNYSEDAESILQAGAELFAGALFGQAGLNHAADRMTSAGNQATAAMEKSGVDSSTGRREIYESTYAELTKDMPTMGRLFSQAAQNREGSMEVLFGGLEDFFMGALTQNLDDRTLATSKTTHVEGIHYNNKQIQALQKEGHLLKQII